jgi:hypothetical protein
MTLWLNSQNDTIFVPIVSYKTTVPDAPLYIVALNDVLMPIEQGKAEITADNTTTTSEFSGLFKNNLPLKIEVHSNQIEVNLEYKIKDFITQYPFGLSDAQITIQPQIPLENYKQTIDCSNITIPKPIPDHHDSYLTINQIKHLPAVAIDSNRFILNWTINNQNNENSLLNTYITFSEAPYLAPYRDMVFWAVGVTIVAIAFEVIYYLTVVPGSRKEKKTENQFAPKYRLNPILIFIGVLAWGTYDLIRIIFSLSHFSWFLPIYYVAFLYWIIMFCFWPFINLFDYLIWREKKTYYRTTTERFILWIRNKPKLFILILIYFFCFILFFVNILFIVAKFPAYPQEMIFQSPFSLVLTISLVTITYFSIYRTQRKLITEQELVRNNLNDLFIKYGSETVNEEEIIKKCQENNISKKNTKLAIKSLTIIDGDLEITGKEIRRVTEGGYTFDFTNKEANKGVIKDMIEKEEKLRKFNNEYGEQFGEIRTASSTIDNFLKKLRVHQK